SDIRTVLYICFALFGSFVAYAKINSYWIILMAPFFALCCSLTGMREKGDRALVTDPAQESTDPAALEAVQEDTAAAVSDSDRENMDSAVEKAVQEDTAEAASHSRWESADTAVEKAVQEDTAAASDSGRESGGSAVERAVQEDTAAATSHSGWESADTAVEKAVQEDTAAAASDSDRKSGDSAVEKAVQEDSAASASGSGQENTDSAAPEAGTTLLPMALLLESLGGIAYFLYLCIHDYSLNEGNILVSRLLLPLLLRVPGKDTAKYLEVKHFMESLGLDRYENLFFSIFVGCMTALLILLCPYVQERLLLRKTKGDQKMALAGSSEVKTVPVMAHIGHITAILRLRLVLLAFVLLLPLYVYLAPANPVAYSNLDKDSEPFSLDLVGEEPHMVSQQIRFSDNRKLSALTLRFENKGFSRRNFGSVRIELIEKDGGACLFQKTIGCSLIENKKDLKLSLKNTPVEAGKTYELHLIGSHGIKDSAGFTLSPYCTESEGDFMKADGEETDRTLQFEIR
ncbi:MAG: hypothetical protein K5989_09420, partial [Lachnospiraceae bacterium]|nr:hypothetical protein [Lachnospiraceae bacterium]